MNTLRFGTGALLVMGLLVAPLAALARGNELRWTAERARAWYRAQPWLVGANFVPASAINQLEMWQERTFDAERIDRELGWAEAVGMNTMRVFLHDLLWQQDRAGFTRRIGVFLGIAARHHIRPLFVLFDSCWDPDPHLGVQHPPTPGVHNSGWVQSPGAAALADPRQYPRLRAYVKGVISSFARDPRVLGWDLWNEPNNGEGGRGEAPHKGALITALLPQVFAWARSAHPRQPLTSGVWDGNWSSDAHLTALQRTQLDESDILSFHNYGWPEEFEERVGWLEARHRPILCTEYMARGAGSTFDAILPIAWRHHVGAINWGLVVGKTQTNLPWESADHPYVKSPPPVWHHDVFRADGKPYREREASILRDLTSRPSP